MKATIEALFGLDGQVAVVTGAASGIGRQIAQVLADAGARVVVADRDVQGGEAAARELGADALAIAVDIASPGSVSAMFEQVISRCGGVDILVNNAAVFPKYDFTEVTAEQWDALMAVTLRGTMLCTQAAVKAMRTGGRGGRIVNISSCSSVRTLVFHNVAYAAAKAGVNMITKTAALEFAGDGITVNAVLPGGVQTGGQQQVTSSLTIEGPIRQPGRVPLGRIGQPADIAAAVLYLASPAASYVTGQLLAVDGGFLIS